MKVSATNPGVRAIKRALFRDQFVAFTKAERFPCVGAKAALNSGSYRIRVYQRLAAPQTSTALAKDLAVFTRSKLCRNEEYASFVAIFETPLFLDEQKFEELLWRQLQELNRIDARTNCWDPAVSSDPRERFFSFSFGGRALYVVGMHGNSSRQARRFPWPTLVFNPHEQFQRLRSKGKWQRLRDTIRSRDIALQGNLNPMLSDFGERSEAAQYSGRQTASDWKPPFEASRPGRCPFAH